MKTTTRWLLLAALGLLLVAQSAPASAEDPLPCRPNLVPCNYGEHFTGTLHWHSVLKASDPPSESIEDITVTIANGKAVCGGTIDGAAIKGAGLLAVERGTSMEDAPDQPWYDITVSCPDGDGSTPNIDNAQIKTYEQKDTSGFKTLAGKVEAEHPDADAVNGVTGTIRIEWSLTRSGNARP